VFTNGEAHIKFSTIFLATFASVQTSKRNDPCWELDTPLVVQGASVGKEQMGLRKQTMRLDHLFDQTFGTECN
jgi:hypothetical protein